MNRFEHANLGAFAFTIAKAHYGRAAKSITRRENGTIEKSDYDHILHWYFSPDTEPSLEAMAARMRRLALLPDRLIIMGEPVPNLPLGIPQRRWWARSEPSENTIRATARWWLPVDVDGVEVPAGQGRPEMIAEAAAWIRDNLLPDEFCGIACIAAATASSGLMGPNIARLRLFFLLDRPVPLEEMRRWGRGARVADLPVDPAVLLPGQPIYSARPMFIGMDDPVAPEYRVALVDGVISDRVQLAAARFNEKLVVVEARVAAAIGASGSDWRAFLVAELGGPAGFFAVLTKASGVAARGDEAIDEIVDFMAALLAQRADRDRIAHYNNAWLAAGIRAFRKRDRAGRARRLASIDAFRIGGIDNV